MKTQIKQMQIYQDTKERLAIARKLEIASIANLRANLRYYGRRKESQILTQAVEQMSDYVKKLNEAQDVNGLMLIEAQARQKYYQCFNEILDSQEFVFTKRTRRPPKDSLNSMISFGNTMLYQTILVEGQQRTYDYIIKREIQKIKKYGSTKTGCAIMEYLKKNYLYRRKFADGIIYLYHQR